MNNNVPNSRKINLSLLMKIFTGIVILSLIGITILFVMKKYGDSPISVTADEVTIKIDEEYKIEVNNEKNYELTWSSSDKNIATVNDGLVKGIKAGDVTITVTTSNKQKDEVKVTVLNEKYIAVENITLDTSDLTLNIDGTKQLTATVLPENATNKKITWNSSDESIVTVNDGLVKGIKTGTAIIMAKSGTKEVTVKVTVSEIKEISVTGVNIKESKKDLSINGKQQYTAVITPSDATDKNVTWSSSNTNVATVSSNGLVTTKNAGATTITVKSSNGKTATIKLSVAIPKNCFIMSGTKITGYSTSSACKTTVMNIPSSLGATEIGGIAFSNSSKYQKLTSVIIPSCITSIGVNPFINNSTITSIVVDSNNPNYKSVNNAIYTKDGKTLITGTKGMSNNIESTVSKIGKLAFSNMNLTSVTIPNGVTTIEQDAFGYNQIGSVIIPNGITVIEKGVFSNNQLTNLIIPNNVKTIRADSFINNKLTNITISSNVAIIELNPFNSNSTLTSIVVDSNNPNYKSVNNAIYTKDGKTLITGTKGMSNNIESTVSKIGQFAFHNMNLTSVTIPNGVTTIEQYAFSRNKLVSVTIPNSVKSIGFHAFGANKILQGNAVIDNNIGAVTLAGYAFSNNGSDGETAITPVYLR